jgi:hypothetical protein
VGQEEDVQELELVDSHLLLNGQGKQVYPHGDVVAGGYLGAQNPAGLLIVNDADLDLVVILLDEAKLDPQKYAGQYNRKINRKGEEGYRF